MGKRNQYAEGTFCWVDLMAKNMDVAKNFYENFFGWKVEMQETSGGPPYALFTKNGSPVAGMGQMTDEMRDQGTPVIWNSYIATNDVEKITQKAESLGGTVFMPPMKIMEAGSMSIIQDPTGGTVSFWQRDQHFGAELVNETHTFCWNDLATRDLEKAKKFYGSLLGWEFEEHAGTPSPYYIIKNQGEMNGGLMEMTEEWGDAPPRWSTYFTVEDIKASTSQAKDCGGSIFAEPFDTPAGPISIVCDSEGGSFYLIQLSNPD